jgi:hypothetical protein
LKTIFCEIPFFETRAGQGFQRCREKKIISKSSLDAKPPPHLRETSKLYFAQKSTTIKDAGTTPRRASVQSKEFVRKAGQVRHQQLREHTMSGGRAGIASTENFSSALQERLQKSFVKHVGGYDIACS